MIIGSLFSGIGGLELGVCEAIGAEVGWQCEIDPFCRRVLAKHWPGARRFEDVTELTGEMVGKTDVMVAGWPCQDLSQAGKGAGIEHGKKSGLWREIPRLIGEIRPRYLVLENVPALLARDLGVVLGDLAARGYDATWDCVPAAACGAPHRRDRWFAICYPDSDSESARSVNARKTPWVRAMAADTDRNRPQGVEHTGATPPAIIGGAWDSWTTVEPRICGVSHGIPDRVHRLRALGNAVVPQVAYRVGLALAEIMAERGEA